MNEYKEWKWTNLRRQKITKLYNKTIKNLQRIIEIEEYFDRSNTFSLQ